nr:NlpC/P60 family protein [Kineosporia babensis]
MASGSGGEARRADRLCSTAPATGAVQRAIAYANRHLGQPYLWGGDGPDAGESGFDCSGLTKAAYQAGGITLPRTAQQQYDHGPRVSVTQLRPGDLVFFGTGPGNVTHVGLYIGGDRMINAPRSGTLVRVEDHRRSTLVGATRPTVG